MALTTCKRTSWWMNSLLLSGKRSLTSTNSCGFGALYTFHSLSKLPLVAVTRDPSSSSPWSFNVTTSWSKETISATFLSLGLVTQTPGLNPALASNSAWFTTWPLRSNLRKPLSWRTSYLHKKNDWTSTEEKQQTSQDYECTWGFNVPRNNQWKYSFNMTLIQQTQAEPSKGKWMSHNCNPA